MEMDLLSKRIDKHTVENNLINLPQIVFEVTEACNLKCKYCVYGDFYTGFEGGNSKNMSFDIAKQTIDFFVNLWEKTETKAEKPYFGIAFYGGEPLLNQPLIEKIIDYVNEHITSRKILYSMTTNAMLLDRYADFIVSNDFILMISLDGNEYEDSYRVQKNGSPSFSAVVKNIHFLQQKYPEYFIEKVSFNTVVHNRNNVENVYDFFMKEFGKVPSFSEISEDGVREDMLEVFNQTFRSISSSIDESNPSYGLEEKLFNRNPSTSELNSYLRIFSGNHFLSYNELLNDEQAPRFPTGTCAPFQTKLFVTVRGKMIQCEKIAHKYSLGTVDDEGVHIDIDKIADDFNRRMDIMQRLCEKCYSKLVCPTCMYHHFGLDEGRPQCSLFMKKSDFEAYEKYCKNYLFDHPNLYRRLWTELF